MKKKEKKLILPIQNEDTLRKFKSGDFVLVSGTVYTMRDAAHKRIIEIIRKNEKLPFNLKNSAIYYTGPTPAPPESGLVFGAAGPTTSDRMDKFTLPLMKKGAKIFIGKGKRSPELSKQFKKYRCLYLSTIGGAGAYLAEKIKSSNIIAYKDLGTEAIRKIYVEDFPCIVIIDSFGKDFYSS